MRVTNLFPVISLARERSGHFAVRAYRKELLSMRSLSAKALVEQLTEQLTQVTTTLRVIVCGTEAVAVYYPGLLEQARLRVAYSPRGGEDRMGRYDLWDPLIHKQFLAEMRGRRYDVKIKKGLRGVYFTSSKLFELDAFTWKVMFEQDLVFKAGAEICL